MTEVELRGERDAIGHNITREYERIAEITRLLTDMQEESRDG